MAIKTIDNQFRVIKLLGEGMSSEVYEVQRGDERWALKLMKRGPHLQGKKSWIEAFKFEFSLLKDIAHPYVVRIGDFGWDRELDRLYFTEELVQGVPLDQFLADKNVKRGEELFIQCLEGLQAIHQAHVLHGDIKPSNIFVVQDRGKAKVKILDLGIAHPQFQLIAGTPAYFAPEKILKDIVDERSDLYSLAVTFYSCLTGVNPFKMRTVGECFKAQTSLAASPAGSLNREIPPYLSRIFANLLSKNPRDRFRSASDVLAQIDLERGEMARKEEAPPPAVCEKWIGRGEAKKRFSDWASSLNSFGIFVVTGPAGIGKTQFLQAAKYELELGGHTVRALTSPNTLKTEKAVYLLDSPSFDPQSFDSSVKSLRKNASGLVMALPQEAKDPFFKYCEAKGIPVTLVVLDPFSKEDVRLLIAESARQANPPAEMIDAVYAQTQGNPAQTVHLLSALCRLNRLLGPHGEWNLAPFREGGIDVGLLEAGDPVVDDLLATTGFDKPAERLLLVGRKLELLLRSGRWNECGRWFVESEKLLQALPAGETRLLLRAQMTEKRGWLSLKEGHWDEAFGEFQAAEALLNEMNAPPLDIVLRLKNFGAYVLVKKGQVDTAVEIFENTRTEWREHLSDVRKSSVVNNDLGMALMQKGEFERAASVFLEDLEFYKSLSDTSYLHRCHYNLGECYFKLSRFDRALEHYKSTASGARKNRQWDLLLRAYNGLGNTTNVQKKTDSALDYYQRGLDLALYLKDFEAAAALAQNRGVIQSEQGKEPVARENLNLSLQYLKQVVKPTPHTLYLKARAILELGDLERVAGRYSQAKNYIGQAKRLTSEEKSLEDFLFWVLHAEASLALDEKDEETFLTLYPDLVHYGKTDEQKKLIEKLLARSPVDPTRPRFKADLTKTPRIDRPPLAGSEAEKNLSTLLVRVEEQNRRLVESLQRAEDTIGEFQTILRDRHFEDELSPFARIKSRSPLMEKVFDLIERIAPTMLSVLIRGESGTGKELVARSIHDASPRKDQKFVAVNCAAFPPNLIESELFGYKAGAFTGAARDKRGFFEEADHGTLFLDEIGETEPAMQVKLLRAIQEREIVRVGDTKPIPIDVRILSATLRNLRDDMKVGQFREDLFYRIAEAEVSLPPLRERKEDIPLLIDHFIRDTAKEQGLKKVPVIDRELKRLFANYSWPGNIRELVNRVRVAAALSDGKRVTLQDLPEADQRQLRESKPLPVSQGSPPVKADYSYFQSVLEGEGGWRRIETAVMAKALLHFDFNVIQAAKALGLGQATLYNRLRRERMRSRKKEWEELPMAYRPETKLDDIKREVFLLAFRLSEEKPYHAARLLKVSPGMFYKWNKI